MTMTVIGGVSDAMSDVLFLVRMRGESICANDFSSPWSVRFHGPFAHFHIVERGSAWVLTDDAPPLRAEAGDLILLPLGAGHSLGDDIDRPAIPIEDAIADHATREGSIFRLGGGGLQTHIVCGQFSFAGVLAPKLLSILPPLIHIRPEPGRPLEWLRITTHFLVEETRHPKPGSAIMISRLLDLLFVQAIRDWGSKNANLLGWLSGVRDAQIGKSLSAIHDHPARTWTVEALADIAGLSRSAFAARFVSIVGKTPLKYVTTWRLDLAADHLRASNDSIGDIAMKVGYGSEPALTRAFKIQFGTTPAAFRRSAQAGRDPRLGYKAPDGWKS